MSHRILIVDDHPLVRNALRSVLEGNFADLACEEAGNFNDASELVAEMDFDFILLVFPVSISRTNWGD